MGGGDVEMNMSEPIPHAYAELYLHTMTRGAQVRRNFARSVSIDR